MKLTRFAATIAALGHERAVEMVDAPEKSKFAMLLTIEVAGAADATALIDLLEGAAKVASVEQSAKRAAAEAPRAEAPKANGAAKPKPEVPANVLEANARLAEAAEKGRSEKLAREAKEASAAKAKAPPPEEDEDEEEEAAGAEDEDEEEEGEGDGNEDYALSKIPDAIMNAPRLAEVIIYLREKGFKTEAALTKEIQRLRDTGSVKCLSRMGADVVTADRVHRTLATLG
jgi:hypothetical protein